MKRVVVSVLMTPEAVQAGTVAKLLRSVSVQTKVPDVVYLVAPSNLTWPESILSKMSQEYSWVRVVRPPPGPVCKLTSILSLEPDPSTWIVFLSPYMSYPPKTLETLVSREDLEAVGFSGRNKYMISQSSWIKPGKTTWLETKGGCGFLRGLFPEEEVMNAWSETIPTTCRDCDDLVVGAWVSKKTSLYTVPAKGCIATPGCIRHPSVKHCHMETMLSHGWFDPDEVEIPWQVVVGVLLLAVIVAVIIVGVVKYYLSRHRVPVSQVRRVVS